MRAGEEVTRQDLDRQPLPSSPARDRGSPDLAWVGHVPCHHILSFSVCFKPVFVPVSQDSCRLRGRGRGDGASGDSGVV